VKGIPTIDYLLKTGNLRNSLELLIGDLRAKHRLPPAYHVGMIVSDIRKAANDLESHGIGPFYIGGGNVTSWIEKGIQKKAMTENNGWILGRP